MSKSLRRDPSRGKVAGICQGIANYTGIDVWLVRLLAIVALLFGNLTTLILYVAAWLLLPKATESDVIVPAHLKSRSWEQGYTPGKALKYAEQRLQDAEQRVATLERYITSSRYSVNRAFKDLK